MTQEIEDIDRMIKDGENELFEITKEKLKIKSKINNESNENLEKYNQLNRETTLAVKLYLMHFIQFIKK